MTVHRSGDLKLTATDFKTTHRGVEIGVKVVAWDGAIPVIAMVELKDGKYMATHILFEFDDSSPVDAVIQAAGGVKQWIAAVLLPKINAALLLRFPPGGGPKPDGLDDIDANLGAVLRWAPQPDGTLKVTAI